MKIGGLQKFSLIDYPGKISAIVFTQGCNFRCPYCYNPELVDPALFLEPLDEAGIFSFLESRQGRLDGVVITGGEPTLQPDLADFICRVRELGFCVKLDTNGSNPQVLQSLIERGGLDYIAMDIKAPLTGRKSDPEDRYASATRSSVSSGDIRRSIDLIISSGVDHEFRTTVTAGCLQRSDYLDMARAIRGAKRYALQKFVPARALDEELRQSKPPSDADLEKLRKALGKYVGEVIVR
jgi:pyruvate formate lyase activating enzyme